MMRIKFGIRFILACLLLASLFLTFIVTPYIRYSNALAEFNRHVSNHNVHLEYKDFSGLKVISAMDISNDFDLNKSSSKFKFSSLCNRDIPILSHLESLVIDCNVCSLQNEDILLISECKKIRNLKIRWHTSSPLQLNGILNLINLQTLDLAGTNLEKDSLCEIHQLTNLSTINLSYTNLDECDLRHLLDCKSIQYVCLNNTHVGMTMLRQLVKNPNIKLIEIANTDINEYALDEIDEIQNSGSVIIHANGIVLNHSESK